MRYGMFAVELLKLKVLFAGVFLFILLCFSHPLVAFMIVLPFIITFIIAFINVIKERKQQQIMLNRIEKVLNFKQAHMYGELQHLTHTEEFLSQAKDMLFEVNAILTEMKTKKYLKEYSIRAYRGELVGEQAVLEYITYSKNEE